MNFNHSIACATVAALALATSGAHSAGDTARSTSENDNESATASKPMTGKQRTTAIGATTGAVAAEVIGGPVGAAGDAGIGGLVVHQGTDASGNVYAGLSANGTIRNAQIALIVRGYNVGVVDGQWSPSTQSAVRRFQADQRLAQSGALDDATLSALGLNR